MLDAIHNLIEWISDDSGPFLAGLFPLMLAGIGALYVLWLIIGYLRVSQVGIESEATIQAALPLPKAPDGAFEPPRGVPYCPVDGLQYPPGARFCTKCERDLLVSCANCGTTIRAADESCYRCGTRQTLALPASD
jgi:hypothetical protein